MKKHILFIIFVVVFLLAISGASYAANTTLNDAIDNSNLNITTDGNAIWFKDTNTTHDGVDAAQSGDINNEEVTNMSTSINGPGKITFWWKVSSEEIYDYLIFYDNGNVLSQISGEVDWTQQNFVLGTGTHILTWQYMKDISLDSGSDCGWVDQVIWTPSTIYNVYPGGSIQTTINSCADNDLILVHGNSGNPATYHENIVINKSLLIQSAGDGNVTVDGSLNPSLPVFLVNSLGIGSAIQGFTIIGSSLCGIYIDNSTGNTILNNTIDGQLTSSRTPWGICLVNCNDTNTILNNTVTHCEEGINLYNTQYAEIMGNTVKDNHWDNIALNLSPFNEITGNLITNADSGIRLIGGSNDNTLYNNNLTANIWTSISLVNSEGNYIEGNILSSNQEGIYLYASNGNLIQHNTATNNIWDGFAIHDSNYNVIYNQIEVTGNTCGVRIIGTSIGNSVSENTISGNTWCGISLESAGNNTMLGNSLSYNHVGIYLLSSSYNQILYNSIAYNDWDGIYVGTNSNNNEITNNAIYNSYYGVRIQSSVNNTACYNDFVDNTIHAYDNSTNNWDNGTTGNYWSAWNTTDPRPIDGGSSVDHYPSTTIFGGA